MAALEAVVDMWFEPRTRSLIKLYQDRETGRYSTQLITQEPVDNDYLRKIGHETLVFAANEIVHGHMQRVPGQWERASR